MANAASGVLDYAAYPIGMLIVAPIVLHALGQARFGVWMVANSAVSMGSIVASGFGDANIQQVATLRARGEHTALVPTVRCLLTLNLTLGVALAALGWALSFKVAMHVAPGELIRDCTWSLRLASTVILTRALETVCVSTQRAFERYGTAIQVSVLNRIVTLGVSALLTLRWQQVTLLMLATLLCSVAALAIQMRQVSRLLQVALLLPGFARQPFRALAGFGAFSWLQAASGVIFSQADRFFLGISLGASVVASYSLCAQLAQPIYGIAAAGLHFLFPYLAGRRVDGGSMLRSALPAFAANAAMSAIPAGLLLLFGRSILRLWAGPAIADAAAPVLIPLVLSAAVLALSVTGTYAQLAMGRVRFVTALNVAGGALMLVLMFALTPRMGARGVALARLSYSLLPLFVYLPLLRSAQRRPRANAAICEGA